MRRRMPPLNALRCFEVAARHCSFKAAADELCVSHSAISHQIKQLEDYLGLELFTRGVRMVELTQAGKVYYPVLRDAFDNVAECTAFLLQPTRPDVLTIQLYSTFAIRWLIPRLQDFQTLHPKINVRIQTAQQDVDFEHDDVDACVMIGQPSSDNLAYTFLFSCEIFPVCSPALLKEKPLTTPLDLVNHTILQVYPSSRDWQVWLQAFQIEQVDPESGLRFDSYDHAISTATKGLGVCLAMPPYVAQELQSGALIEPFSTMRARHDREWYFVCRKEKSDKKKISVFRDWLLGQVASDPDLTHYREQKNTSALG